MGQARQSASTKRLGALAAEHAALKKDRQGYLILQAELLTKERNLEAEVVRRVEEATTGYRRHIQLLEERCSSQAEKLHRVIGEARIDAEAYAVHRNDLRRENKALRTLSTVLLAGIAIVGTGALFLL